MPSLGPAEILVILVIALLVFGPNKMPDIARQVGRGVREFRRVQQHLTTELRDVVSEFDGSNDSASTNASSPGSDPVPTLPPRIDADSPESGGPETGGAETGGPAPDASAPHTSTAPPDPTIAVLATTEPNQSGDIPRGQRVWLPPTPPADA
jgi:sec-independent protein translocase protein TatA